MPDLSLGNADEGSQENGADAQATLFEATITALGEDEWKLQWVRNEMEIPRVTIVQVNPAYL
jgi:hypothetical protein